MSLRGFHIVFVTAASLLFAFLVMWGFFFAEEGDSWAKIMSALGIVGLLGMPLYGRYFLRKAERENLN
ncbi:MAG: hypothetical protein ACO3SO_01530 [Luteolibacter sp.]